MNLEFPGLLAFWSGLQGRMKAGLPGPRLPTPLFSPPCMEALASPASSWA